jgi:hypothetical protein
MQLDEVEIAARRLEIRATANYEYPVHLLEGCETGLLLFGAGFLGRNDGIHFLDAGLRCHVVDSDNEKLTEMESIYPDTWTFECADVFDFITYTGRRWDAVSVDPPLALMLGCMNRRHKFIALAAKVLVIGTRTWDDAHRDLPNWKSELEMTRNAHAKWKIWTPKR